MKKYCSVDAMVKQTSTQKTAYEIVEERFEYFQDPRAVVHGDRDLSVLDYSAAVVRHVTDDYLDRATTYMDQMKKLP